MYAIARRISVSLTDYKPPPNFGRPGGARGQAGKRAGPLPVPGPRARNSGRERKQGPVPGPPAAMHVSEIMRQEKMELESDSDYSQSGNLCTCKLSD